MELSVVSFQFSGLAAVVPEYRQMRVMRASHLAFDVQEDLQENEQLKTEN